jgi:hypothetical protein
MVKNEMGGSCSWYGGEDIGIDDLVRKPEGRRTLGRLRRRWEDNIKTNLQEVGYGSIDWINLAQNWDRRRAFVRVNGVVDLRVPLNEGNFLTR